MRGGGRGGRFGRAGGAGEAGHAAAPAFMRDSFNNNEVERFRRLPTPPPPHVMRQRDAVCCVSGELVNWFNKQANKQANERYSNESKQLVFYQP